MMQRQNLFFRFIKQLDKTVINSIMFGESELWRSESIKLLGFTLDSGLHL